MGNLLLDLKQKHAAALDGANALRTAIGARTWTAEENAKLDGFITEADGAFAAIKNHERIDAAMGNIHSDRVTGGSQRTTVFDNEEAKPWGYNLIGEESVGLMQRRPARGAHPAELKQWRETLAHCFGEYLISVASAGYTKQGRGADKIDVRLLALDELEKRAAYQSPAGASEQVPSDGGFLIAPDFASEVLKLEHETGVIFPLTRELPVSAATNTVSIPAIDERSRQDGYRWGGIQGFWENEAFSLVGSKPGFSLLTLVLKKLTGLFYATNEVLADARMLGMLAMQGFAEEFGFKKDDGIVNGTGAGQLQGILSANAAVQVAALANQIDLLVYENVKAMWTRMWPRSRQNAVWLINQDLEASLMGLAQVVGTGGIPVYLPPGSVGGMYGAATAKPIVSNVELNDVNGMLFGRPVVIVEQCQTAGTVGDIILFDPLQYILATKGGIQPASSMHVRFLTDEMTYRFIERLDGNLWWKSSIVPKNGNNTMSPVITLGTRV